MLSGTARSAQAGRDTSGMEATSEPVGDAHLSAHHLAASPRMLAIVCGCILMLGGCSQSTSPDEHAQVPAETSAESPPIEYAADAPSEAAPSDAPDPADAAPPEPSDVKVARAESRIEVPTEPPREVPEEQPAAQELTPPGPLPAAEAPLPLDNVETANLTMPKVVLTEGHAATCRVGVGDAFPEIELADPAGEKKQLASLRGEKLTLVVFWNAREPVALEELSDLARYHQPRFGHEGLSIVAVNTGNEPQLAAELAKEAKATYPILCDPQGEALAKVATSHLPRTYLLDAQGQVLWFDLEYSPTTRRDLAQAIRYALAH
jgi:peroxiredoxin